MVYKILKNKNNIKDYIKSIFYKKIIIYITIILVLAILIYINPLIIITLAEENQDIQLQDLEKKVENLQQQVNSLQTRSNRMVICIVLVIVISIYNWEAMYVLKEILKRK